MLKHLQRFPQSPRQGWPSFRDAEVVWENVRCLKNGEAVRCRPCSALPPRNPRRCEARVSKRRATRDAQRAVALRFSLGRARTFPPVSAVSKQRPGVRRARCGAPPRRLRASSTARTPSASPRAAGERRWHAPWAQPAGQPRQPLLHQPRVRRRQARRRVQDVNRRRRRRRRRRGPRVLLLVRLRPARSRPDCGRAAARGRDEPRAAGCGQALGVLGDGEDAARRFASRWGAPDQGFADGWVVIFV